MVVDGFFARRENLAVMISKRQDETYDQLEKYWKNFEDKGYKTDILSGLRGRWLSDLGTTQPLLVIEARMVALMLKALEQRSGIGHRQPRGQPATALLSGLLPRNVVTPEWLLFGLGSFFETPLQSPWSGIGAPSSYYLPRWHELKAKGFEKKPVETLMKVVSDTYFRSLPSRGERQPDPHRL